MALSIDSMVKQACLFLAKKNYFHTSINKNIKKNWILFKKVWTKNDIFDFKKIPKNWVQVGSSYLWVNIRVIIRYIYLTSNGIRVCMGKIFGSGLDIRDSNLVHGSLVVLKLHVLTCQVVQWTLVHWNFVSYTGCNLTMNYEKSFSL